MVLYGSNLGNANSHSNANLPILLAGGGFRAGQIHGATDDVGYRAVTDRVGVPDLHATLLHQLGVDHERLTYHRHGSDESLTDARVSGARVVSELLS